MNSDDELAQRGRAIFERLREATTDDTASDQADPQPGAVSDEAVGLSIPAPDTVEAAEDLSVPEASPPSEALEPPESANLDEATHGDTAADEALGGGAPPGDDRHQEPAHPGVNHQEHHTGAAADHDVQAEEPPPSTDEGPGAEGDEAGAPAIDAGFEQAADGAPSDISAVADDEGGPTAAVVGEAETVLTVAGPEVAEPEVAEPVVDLAEEREDHEPLVVDDGAVPQLAPTVAPAPASFVRPLPRVMAIANQKGGVGKTTTAVNLSAALAELGYRVLVIDLDPQGNATTGLGVNPRNLESSVYDVLMHDVALEDCIEPTSLRNLFVVPATIDLAGAEIELVPSFSRELKLRKALEAVIDDFDFVLIDCPPSLGLITVNGLAAASEVVVPIQCEYYALEGLGQLLRNVNLVQGNLNPKLEVSAIILTMYDARTKLADQVATEVRTHFGTKVCRNIVPRTVRLSEAPSFGQPIIVFDPSSRGAIAYRELAKEVSGGAPQRVG